MFATSPRVDTVVAKTFIRCMGGGQCSHLPGQCTSDPEYQAKAKASRLKRNGFAEGPYLFDCEGCGKETEGDDLSTHCRECADSRR